MYKTKYFKSNVQYGVKAKGKSLINMINKMGSRKFLN